MLAISVTSQMKRDLKLVAKRGKLLKKLDKVLDILVHEMPLPERYRNHRLTGTYKGYWECHIEPDWLLIYLKNDDGLVLVRTGSHADLFG